MHKTKILLAGLSLLALTTAASAVDVRISGWGGAEVALVNGLITDVLADDLKAADITVKYEPVDGDFSQFITNALSAGTAPDLFYTDIFWSRAAFGTGKVEATTADTSPFEKNSFFAVKNVDEGRAPPESTDRPGASLLMRPSAFSCEMTCTPTFWLPSP